MKKFKRNDLIVLTCLNTNISLRPIDESDTDLIVRWRNAENVRSCFIFRETLTEEMHKKWIKTKVNEGNAIQYIIEVNNSHIPIGSIYIKNIDLQNESGEFGIFIGESVYQGKGYGTNAIKLFTSFCFSLGFNRIFLRVFEENKLAINCYYKAGFRNEGIAREMVLIDGKRFDIVFMSMLKNDNTF